jgi:antirestriction protein ArdC
MPWHTSGKFAFSPTNVTSKKPYRGINTLCLWAAAQAKGYERGEWATYNQWQERGAQVCKGEKATTVVFWNGVANCLFDLVHRYNELAADVRSESEEDER